MGRKKVSEIKDRTINAVGSATPGHSNDDDGAKTDIEKCGTRGGVDNAHDSMNETSG